MTSAVRRVQPTRIRIDRDARVTTLEPGGLVTPRYLGRHGRTARVCLVGHQAMLLAGDRLELEIEVSAGAHLELVESAATVAYNGRGEQSTWSARIQVGESASLTWRSEPFVVAAGADVNRLLDVTVDDGGVAALYESLVLGRHAESGGSMVSRTRALYAGAPLLVETLDLRDPVSRSRPGVLGHHRVLASAMVLGLPVCPTVGPHSSPLAGQGGWARVLDTDAHGAEQAIKTTWNAWTHEVNRHTAASD